MHILTLLADPNAWAALLTLTVLEIVLGIDNLVFISVLTSRLDPQRALRARRIGLSLAFVFRVIMLAGLTWLMGLTAPLFSIFHMGISWRDIILIGGGLFLIAKATHEIHAEVEAREGEFTMQMPASRWLCNAFGALYGGVTALFADVAMTLAVGTTVPAATAYSPLDMTVHFLRPILPEGELFARARVGHRGRTIAVVSCEIVDAKGKLMAQASGSTLILPGRAWERPVNVAEEIPAGAEAPDEVDRR